MSDSLPLQSPTSKLFASPRLFMGFSAKTISDLDSTMSPTSILDSFSPIDSPRKPFAVEDNRAIGLGIVDTLSNHTKSRRVLFGSELKIQIPSVSPAASFGAPTSPIEFGAKTKNSQLALHSPSWSCRSPPMASDEPASFPLVFPGCLSPQEMELSEDYTRVISRGPNPKTTHIFDNYIVQSCGSIDCTSDDFLSFCHACKKDLGQGKEIFMYRGEKAFCSDECRRQEMMFDDEIQ